MTRRDAIYAAVHERITRLRIELHREYQIADAIDARIAQAGEAAAQAAIEASVRPLRARRFRPEDVPGPSA